MSPMSVGFAGLGRMGAPMAARIAGHGFPLAGFGDADFACLARLLRRGSASP